MSYEETRSTPPPALSPNAQAWRRLAVEGYHRTAEWVRTTRAQPLPSDEAPHDSSTAESHQSGFQGL